MKNTALFLLLIFAINRTTAQELKADVSYFYLYSNEWDKAIQTYNFSRPFVPQKQPLLMHGFNASASYIFKSEKKFNHGINVSYSRVKSAAKNENLDNALILNFLNIGYILHYDNPDKLKGFYADLIISVTSSGLFRRVNGEPFEYDDTKAQALGIGGNLSFKGGYQIHLKNKFHLSPFILLGYTPYMYSANTEAVINQTKGLSSKSWTGILNAQIGLAFHIKPRLSSTGLQ